PRSRRAASTGCSPRPPPSPRWRPATGRRCTPAAGADAVRDLFETEEAAREELAEGAVLLRGRARALESELLAALAAVGTAAPFRRMVTPGGFEMSVAMTN